METELLSRNYARKTIDFALKPYAFAYLVHFGTLNPDSLHARNFIKFRGNFMQGFKRISYLMLFVYIGLNMAVYAQLNESKSNDGIDQNNAPSVKLSGCLNLIHNYYNENLISTEPDDELAKIKRVTAGVFLSGLSVPADISSDSCDFGLEDKIKEILKSGSVIQKEAAVHFISYMMFNYESEYGTDNVYFNLIWTIFSDEWRRESFFNLCVQIFTSAPDVEINICKAYYDLFCRYVFKEEHSVNSDDLSKIIEIGLKNEDFFVQACVQMLKFYEIKGRGDWTKEDYDFFKNDVLIKAQEIYLNKFVFKNGRPTAGYNRIDTISEDVRKGSFDERYKQIIEKKIKKFKNRAMFNAFINLCNTAIDSNVGIKNIIEIMGKVSLESCNYDFNKDLLKLCTRLTKHSDFFDTGLRFMQEYNEMGGLFSYGDEYYHFCSKLICNNLERFHAVDKIQEYVLSNIQSYNLLGSFVTGIIIYEGMIAANSDDILNEYAKIIRYIRKNSEGNAHDVIWYGIKDCYLRTNPMELIHFLLNKQNKKILRKDSLVLGMLFSKVYVCQNTTYNFLDITYIFGVFTSKKSIHQDVVDFLSMMRSECPLYYEDMVECGCRRIDPIKEYEEMKALEPFLDPSFCRVCD